MDHVPSPTAISTKTATMPFQNRFRKVRKPKAARLKVPRPTYNVPSRSRPTSMRVPEGGSVLAFDGVRISTPGGTNSGGTKTTWRM
jgi:hypothetical protein